jgi:hypothetical protein
MQGIPKARRGMSARAENENPYCVILQSACRRSPDLSCPDIPNTVLMPRKCNLAGVELTTMSVVAAMMAAAYAACRGNFNFIAGLRATNRTRGA